MLLEGRAGLVTGGAQGLGRAIALGLTVAGAKVVVNDINAAGADETVALIAASGGAAALCAGDISDAGS